MLRKKKKKTGKKWSKKGKRGKKGKRNKVGNSWESIIKVGENFVRIGEEKPTGPSKKTFRRKDFFRLS